MHWHGRVSKSPALFGYRSIRWARQTLVSGMSTPEAVQRATISRLQSAAAAPRAARLSSLLPLLTFDLNVCPQMCVSRLCQLQARLCGKTEAVKKERVTCTRVCVLASACDCARACTRTRLFMYACGNDAQGRSHASGGAQMGTRFGTTARSSRGRRPKTATLS